MEKEKLKEFTFRVSQASRSELVVITYDIILEDTKAARAALAQEDAAGYDKELKHAARFVNELMACLDYRFPLSYELLSLYSYVNKTMIAARIQRKPELLDAVDRIFSGLRAAFAQVSAQDTSGSLMENVETVYAGLTYGRGYLNESLLDPNGSRRGFTA